MLPGAIYKVHILIPPRARQTMTAFPIYKRDTETHRHELTQWRPQSQETGLCEFEHGAWSESPPLSTHLKDPSAENVYIFWALLQRDHPGSVPASLATLSFTVKRIHQVSRQAENIPSPLPGCASLESCFRTLFKAFVAKFHNKKDRNLILFFLSTITLTFLASCCVVTAHTCVGRSLVSA